MRAAIGRKSIGAGRKGNLPQLVREEALLCSAAAVVGGCRRLWGEKRLARRLTRYVGAGREPCASDSWPGRRFLARRAPECRPPEASERRASRAVAAGLTQMCPRSRWGSDPAGKTTAKGERTCLHPLSERVVGGGAGESGPRRDVASGFGTRQVSKWKRGALPDYIYRLTEKM